MTAKSTVAGHSADISRWSPTVGRQLRADGRRTASKGLLRQRQLLPVEPGCLPAVTALLEEGETMEARLGQISIALTPFY